MNTTQAFTDQFRDMFDFGNFGNVAEIQRRNVEALTAANQMMVENAQAISQRQAELAQSSLQEVIEASREVLSSGTPEAGLAKQAELTKHLFEDGVENAREVIELITKSGFEALDLINQCAAEGFSDMGKPTSARKRRA